MNATLPKTQEKPAAQKTARAIELARRLTLVSQEFGVSVEDIMSPDRGYDLIVRARAAAYFVLCDIADYTEVGRIIGGRSAHAVRLAVNKVHKRRTADKSFDAQLRIVIQQIKDC